MLRAFGVAIVVAAALSTGPGTLAQSAEPVDVSFMVFGDPAELAAYKALEAAFEEGRPDIDVELIHIPSQDDYRQRLAADFAAGTPADAILINYRRYATFAARGLLEPLGPNLAASDLIDEADFHRQALDPFRWNGRLTCIPQNLSSLVVYYDKDLFDAAGLAYPAAGWTWDDFLTTAKALTKDLDGDGVTDQHGLGTEASLIRVAPFIWQHGGELVVLEEGVRPIRLALDARLAREAIEWFVALQTEHHVVPNAVEEAARDSESRFLDGHIGMFLDSRRVVPTFREITAFDWDVAPLPRGEKEAGIIHSDAYCMPSAARDKEATWDFIEYASSVEGQAIIAATGRTVPSQIDVADSPAFLDPAARPANSRAWLDAMAHLRAVPVMGVWADIEGIVDQELERAYYGVAGLDEAIAQMIDRTTPYFLGAEG